MQDPQRIKALRLMAGWSQKDMASRLGVTWLTVSNWERGRNIPQPAHREALDRLLQKLTA